MFLALFFGAGRFSVKAYKTGLEWKICKIIAISIYQVVYVMFIIFYFTFLNMYGPTNNYNVVFGNVEKRKTAVEKFSDIRFITGIVGIVARDDCYAEVPL